MRCVFDGFVESSSFREDRTDVPGLLVKEEEVATATPASAGLDKRLKACLAHAFWPYAASLVISRS